MPLAAMKDDYEATESEYSDEKAALASDVYEAAVSKDKEAFIAALGEYTIHCIEAYFEESEE